MLVCYVTAHVIVFAFSLKIKSSYDVLVSNATCSHIKVAHQIVCTKAARKSAFLHGSWYHSCPCSSPWYRPMMIYRNETLDGICGFCCRGLLRQLIDRQTSWKGKSNSSILGHHCSSQVDAPLPLLSFSSFTRNRLLLIAMQLGGRHVHSTVCSPYNVRRALYRPRANIRYYLVRKQFVTVDVDSLHYRYKGHNHWTRLAMSGYFGKEIYSGWKNLANSITRYWKGESVDASSRKLNHVKWRICNH